MALHTYIPSRAQINKLAQTHEPWAVSIYMPTTSVSSEADANRIAFKNHAAEAVARLQELDAPKPDVAAIEQSFDDLVEDADFWHLQSRSFAAFATPRGLRTFRLPNQLTDAVQVADRFYVKPLLRTVTFPQAAYVLELAQGSARLLEIAPDTPPEVVPLDGVPHEAPGSEPAGPGLSDSAGEKQRMRGSDQIVRYARLVNDALRVVLAGSELPLILAATRPMDAAFRSVNSYPHLLDDGLRGNPEAVGDTELADETRGVLDAHYAAQLEELAGLFELRSSQGRAASDITDIARAATFGAVDTLFVDIDSSLAGQISEDTGEVSYGESIEEVEPGEYSVEDEIARRVLLAHGHVLAVRRDEVPGGGSAAAILRYPV
jgi:hypothetical protein